MFRFSLFTNLQNYILERVITERFISGTGIIERAITRRENLERAFRGREIIEIVILNTANRIPSFRSPFSLLAVPAHLEQQRADGHSVLVFAHSGVYGRERSHLRVRIVSVVLNIP